MMRLQRLTLLVTESTILPAVVVWSAVLPLLSTVLVTSARPCRTDFDCDKSTGQECYYLYEGCDIGQCMCDPRHHVTDSRGRCVRLKELREPCQQSDICRPGMQCRDGRCVCSSGVLSLDGQYCLQAGERLLGETCRPNKDVCFQLGTDGYTHNEVNCSARGRCQCAEGYKSNGYSCKRWNIGDHGCLRSHHCSGGAICVDGACLCPSGYHTTADNSKCARDGATTNIPYGQQCDEISERRYCSTGHVCHRCPGEQRSKCVRFLMVNEFAFLLSDAASPWQRMSLLQHLPTLVLYFVWICAALRTGLR